MKIRSLVKFTAAAAIVLSSVQFLSCKKTEDKSITLVMAELNSENSICGIMDQAFKEKVEALSNNKIAINIKFNGVLGNEKKVIEALQTKDGYVQIARIGSNLTEYGIKESGLISIPYTFISTDSFWKFAGSDTASQILDAPYKSGLGIKGLFYAEEGFRCFFGTTPLNSFNSLKGKKTRVNGSILPKIADAFGSIPVQIDFNRLEKAFINGDVEVADQPLTNYYNNGFYEFAPNLILDKHMLGTVQVAISSHCWDSLSQKQRDIIIEAGKYAANVCRELDNDNEKNIINELKSKNVEVKELKSIKDWQYACKDLISELSKDYPELYNEIQSFNY